MGENIAKLFNGIVDQFQQNNTDMSSIQLAPHIPGGHRDSIFDSVRLTEDFAKPEDPIVMVPENDDADLPIVKIDDTYYDKVPSVEEVEPTEMPILSKIMKEPPTGVVHLYGHHRFSEIGDEPRNHVNI